MLAYPKIHAADGPFTNPAAYWTTLSDETCMAFRIAGTAFLVLVMGPFFDEIFGGAGVKMMAFARQMCMGNAIAFFIFMYYTFYSPLPTAVPMIWQIQTIFAGVLLGWSICEVIFESLKTYYITFSTLEFGFFALTLMSFPDTLYGPPSPLAYWNTWTDFGILTARSQGLGMFVAFIVGYYYFGPSSDGFAKMMTVWNVAITSLCAIPAFYGGSSAVTSMWLIQFTFQLPVALVGVYLEIAGETGPWKFSLSCPSMCGLNVKTYLFVNLCFYAPFVAAFLTNPNMMFGPNNPMGADFAMFTVELDETALWFGKGWAVSIFLISISPYLFGLDEVKVTKMVTVTYLLFVGLFVYALVYLSVFNLMLVGPMTGLNVIFFAVGLYLVTKESKESLFMA